MNWLIKLLGGYTQEEYSMTEFKCRVQGNQAGKLTGMQNERNRLTYLLSEAKQGRVVLKIQNELTNVTNQILRMESDGQA